jgi:2-polyprenyl-3-methyl-5-hydroxy-6-metoxy-1,4-benzoquinol methylase
MEANKHNYIISGGKDGKSRLDVLSRVLCNSTKSLLTAHGLGEGVSFLDVGCGGGNVTLMAAAVAGRKGQATGIDLDSKVLELARQDAETAGATNVRYHELSACDMTWKDWFDMAYSRFLLSHLQRPAEVLQNMVESVKPGGSIVIEDIYFSGHFCYPACDAFSDYVRYYKQAAVNNGQNADIGPSLYGMFLDAGITDTGFDVILPAFHSGEGKWMAWLTLDRIKDTLAEQGIATADEVANMLQRLEAFTGDEHTVISMPAIFRVWGTRPGDTLRK